VPSPYTRPVIKLLFATARTCAYPGCQVPLVFEDHERGIRSVAVQIAHIRSARRSGPRHDPGYPEDRLNAEENLLLLCNPHHHPVDSNESEYTIDQLLEWKKAQVTASGGFLVGDEEVAGLAAALQVSLDEIVQSTRLQVQVRLVGGRIGWTPGVARMNLDGLGETEQTMGHLFRPGRLIGVEAENRGMVGADVQAAGIEIDHGPEQPGPWQYAFPDNRITQWGLPCRIDGHATRVWFETEDRIRGFTDALFVARGLSPQRFRSFAELGDGDRVHGDWIARADLPIWEPGTGEAQLRARFGEPAW
jgi:hypothetical protein